jgi:hypothetical protein
MNFYEIIQTYFTDLTGRAVVFSGRDLSLLNRWRDQGGTPAMICQGLRDAVETFDADDPPRDLYTCRAFVEPYIERARRLFTGPGAREATPESADAGARPDHRELRRAQEAIEFAGRRVEREPLKEIYRDAWRWVRRMMETPEALDDVYAALASLEEEIFERAYRALPVEQRRAIKEKIRSENGELLRQMSPQAREEHLAARRRKYLVEQYDLVPLGFL